MVVTREAAPAAPSYALRPKSANPRYDMWCGKAHRADEMLPADAPQRGGKGKGIFEGVTATTYAPADAAQESTSVEVLWADRSPDVGSLPVMRPHTANPRMDMLLSCSSDTFSDHTGSAVVHNSSEILWASDGDITATDLLARPHAVNPQLEVHSPYQACSTSPPSELVGSEILWAREGDHVPVGCLARPHACNAQLQARSPASAYAPQDTSPSSGNVDVLVISNDNLDDDDDEEEINESPSPPISPQALFHEDLTPSADSHSRPLRPATSNPRLREFMASDRGSGRRGSNTSEVLWSEDGAGLCNDAPSPKSMAARVRDLEARLLQLECMVSPGGPRTPPTYTSSTLTSNAVRPSSAPPARKGSTGGLAQGPGWRASRAKRDSPLGCPSYMLSGMLMTDEQLEEQYRTLDPEGVGCIPKKRFKDYYLSLEHFGMAGNIDQLLLKFNKAGRDSITFDEFAILMLQIAKR